MDVASAGDEQRRGWLPEFPGRATAPSAAPSPEPPDAPTVPLPQHGATRLKGVHFSVPIVTGTVAFYLGKKVTEAATHRWTCYLRTDDGRDASGLFESVRFSLHSSFAEPERDIRAPPYELTQSGWGEFDIGVTVTFPPDAGVPPVELVQRLALYDAPGAAASARRPVVSEQREELVFWEPTEALWARFAASEGTRAPASQLEQFFTVSSEDAEYRRIQAARQRVAHVAAATAAQLGG